MGKKSERREKERKGREMKIKKIGGRIESEGRGWRSQ